MVSVDLSSVRRPTTRETWSVNPRTMLVRVGSPSADLEWAVPERQFEWATDVVFQQAEPG